MEPATQTLQLPVSRIDETAEDRWWSSLAHFEVDEEYLAPQPAPGGRPEAWRRSLSWLARQCESYPRGWAGRRRRRLP